jgi:hypothetical protein
VRGWQIGFPHSPLIAQITLGPVKLYFSLIEVYWFCAFCDVLRGGVVG